MKKKLTAWILVFLLGICALAPVGAAALSQTDTPDYKVAFYAFDCFNMLDENGKRSGYGYEMMQNVSHYMQATFSYVGYDKSASESVDMLRNGELDLYTAAKKTPEHEAEFAFSTHPFITSFTYMNVKVGNDKIVAGDYSTYNGIRIGLLQRHTYNDKTIAFAKEKGFDCEFVYYDTPTELTNALINDEVDALANSYIRIPEDEKTIENFGETPYYIIARKEDQALIDQIDAAIDRMNVETPNWRTELYNKYYGSEDSNLELTEDEQALLETMRNNGDTIRAVMSPNANPYSWFEDGEAKGMAPDIFRATAEKLGLNYEIIPVADKAEYEAAIASGDVDIWMDMNGVYEDEGADVKYKITDPYLTTTLSVLRARGSSDKITTLVTDDDNIAIREVISNVWGNDVDLLVVDSLKQCQQAVLNGKADGALLMSYTAQRLARDDIQNRLRADIVPAAVMELKMAINADTDVHFYGLWSKTLAAVADSSGAEITQNYLEQTTTPTMLEYLFDHPVYLITFCTAVFLILLLLILFLQSVRRKREQEKISVKLAAAFAQAEEATEAKQNFFSKMSHDIRTPLNVVLGMTQVARKYKNDTAKLDKALANITTEGNYLLVLINSILDVNQLEHGAIELLPQPFNPAECLQDCADVLQPLSGKKEQTVTVQCDRTDRVVIGDVNRLKQILINIISNAIKYTEDGGHISLRLECLPDKRYRFTCTDDGIGMSEEFVQHICEDYARAEDSRVSKIQGTGLGMSVIKGFTDLMGGTLHIESTLGQGSTFTVEFPFPDASDEQREAVLHPAVEADSGRARYIGRKVLLVEDNALNAEIATELLQSIGLAVDWAENGEVGVKRYEDSKIDEYFAIFMDMQMPVMDGVTATRRIRQSSRSDRDIPVFAMTANTFASDRRSCREAGMNGYIPKPVSVKNISEALTVLNDQ